MLQQTKVTCLKKKKEQLNFVKKVVNRCKKILIQI